MKLIHVDKKNHGLTRSMFMPPTMGIAAFLCAALLFITQVWAADEAFILDEITVVGQKIDDYIEKNPNQVETMGTKEMAERNFLDPYEILSSIPGVDVARGSSGIGAQISIRGGGGSGGVLVLVDGRPMNSGQFKGVDLARS